MNILISDTARDMERMSQYRVSKVDSVKPVQERTPETIKEAGQRIAAENTPVFMISISSQGRALLQSMQKFTEATRNSALDTNRQNDDINAKDSLFGARDRKISVEEAFGSTETAASAESGDDITISAPDPLSDEPEVKESEGAKVRSNLSTYTDAQLRSLERNGDISVAEMNKELGAREREALKAYGVQMSFSNGQIPALLY